MIYRFCFCASNSSHTLGSLQRNFPHPYCRFTVSIQERDLLGFTRLRLVFQGWVCLGI